jgi:hypothetical protein
MQCVARCDGAKSAAAPENDVPGAHGESPIQKDSSHCSGIGQAQWWRSLSCDDLSDRHATVRNGDWPSGQVRET